MQKCIVSECSLMAPKGHSYCYIHYGSEMTTLEKLNKIKESLSFDQQSMVFEMFQIIESRSYDQGFTNGLQAYAYWKDGVQYVGTTGRTLLEALFNRQQTHTYNNFIDWVTNHPPYGKKPND